MAKDRRSSRAAAARLLSGLGAFPVSARHRRPRRAGDLPPAPRGRPRARALPRGHSRPRARHAAAPRRGAGRLAIEAQAPIVPCAITGTDRLFERWFPAVKVQVSFAPAIEPAQLEATPEAAADLIENQVWPEVEREFHRLRTKPGLIAAVIAALSRAAGGSIAYKLQRKPKKRDRLEEAQRRARSSKR